MKLTVNPDRRAVLASLGSLLTLSMAGCAAVPPPPRRPDEVPPTSIPDHARLMYRAMPEERFPIPAVDLTKLEPRFYRQVVDYPTSEKPGTVIVDPAQRHLYHVQDGGTAMRYGVGIGKAGFEWSGRAHIAYGREWPVWTPPESMIARQPELARWRQGQPPGIDNALGARAFYVHEGNRDTLYRLHGTSHPETIGKAVSSGCVRLLNQDIVDLYQRVRFGSPLVVLA
ncbi:L,D-transpeptidase [Agaricicola taiwanensis]|uniref:L,D-transpeptidase n=1 Tax=Agaricicola taiwanensis TaxID=591372 RepID=A0A8J2YMT0_9RHOB|nr:L,D-transpeptidase [Agaricicola taiwanensis]GGE53761.1 L,D-transpeptidase [Agaricicola taiwanensis]